MPAVSAATCQVLLAASPSPVDDGHRLASYKTLLVVGLSGGVDCGSKRRNVYDKKRRRYAKDNRTAHLTARGDKSVAYVTNNKRLYSTFCTVEANYWQSRSIARPLCDSRATCQCTWTVPSPSFKFTPISYAEYVSNGKDRHISGRTPVLRITTRPTHWCNF